uniref:Pellino n=1 Tax=Plectus sambesii TaxID=2011161 RepID=A0A914URN1_9BILA
MDEQEPRSSAAMVVDGEQYVKYGELIVLGYNGSQESGRKDGNGRRHRSKMIVGQRSVGNGIKKAAVSTVSVPAQLTQAVQDRTRHVVSYTYSRNHTVLVEYTPDVTKDMFQVGRSSETQIDFTVVDTWLASGGNILPPGGNSPRCVMPQQADDSNGGRPISSTISRYACRILVDRDQPHTARLYAAGFDASRNVFLGEKATKWTKKNGEVDGLTTNGILILHPHRTRDSPDAADDEQIPDNPMYVWREVSVDGDIYTLRETRSSSTRGDRVRDET